MAIQTVWSVDLGKSSLKAVKLRRSQGNVEIAAIDKVDYPVSKNGVDATAQAREALEIFASRNAVREPVAVLHPGQGTFSRFIKVPAFDDKKVGEMVGHEAAQQIPFPLDEVSWDYHVIQREYLPGEEREVALFAVRRETIDDFLLEFTSHDLSVETVSIGYLGLLNFVRHDIAPTEPALVLDIGATHTDLVLVDGDRFWIRPLPHSGNAITKAIQERFKISFADAEKLKLETARVPQKAVKIFQTVIQPKLKELVSEIHRSIGFYRSQHGEISFPKLYLLGNGSKIIGIKKFLEESLNLQVEKVQSIHRFRVSRDVNIKVLQAHLPAFASTLGGGLQALGLATCQVDLVPSEEKLAKEVSRKKKHAFFAAVLVLGALFIASFMVRGAISDSRDTGVQADRVLDGLKGGETVLAEFDQTLDGYEDLIAEVKDVAAIRGKALEALDALDAVLATFQNAKDLSFTIAETDDAGRAAVGREMEFAFLERAWIPWLEMERTTHTFTPAAPADGGDASGTPPAPRTVPAYAFRAFVVIKQRGTAQESLAVIQERLQKPLESEFKNRGLSIVPVVEGAATNLVKVAAPQRDLQEIVHAGGGGRGSNTEAGQEGRPFDGVEISWTLVAEFPEPQGLEPAGGPAGPTSTQ